MVDSQEEKPILFGPRSGKSILRSHPEIGNDPIFKDLANDEILFAWYLGIPNSPVDEDWSQDQRFKSAASKAFKGDKYHKYASGDFSDAVKIAIRKFQTYNPDARLQAKLMAQRTFHNWMDIVNSKVDDMVYFDKDGNKLTDWTARKQYVDSTKDITRELPTILKQLEEGFGINEAKKTEQVLGAKPIDKFHQEKKN